MGFALVLAVFERTQRGQAKYHQTGKRHMKMPPAPLTGWRAWLAFGLCLVPVVFGFALPAIVLFDMGLGSEQNLFAKR